MSLKEIRRVKNGDMIVPYYIFRCDNCGADIEEAWPRTEEEDKHFCPDCSFRLGLILADKYKRWCGIDLPWFHVAINPDGKIETWTGKNNTPPWLRGKKEQRNSTKYRQWRTAVFERDNYICQDCGQRGGNLNAHHLKSFKNYPRQRYVISNGITLCEKCHRLRHKRR